MRLYATKVFFISSKVYHNPIIDKYLQTQDKIKLSKANIDDILVHNMAYFVIMVIFSSDENINENNPNEGNNYVIDRRKEVGIKPVAYTYFGFRDSKIYEDMNLYEYENFHLKNYKRQLNSLTKVEGVEEE